MVKVSIGALVAAVAALGPVTLQAAAPLCGSDGCRSAQADFERGATAEFKTAIADAPGLLTHSGGDSRYAVSGNGRLLRSLCQGDKNAAVTVAEAKRSPDGGLALENVYTVAAGQDQKAACAAVSERMALKLREPVGPAGAELNTLARQLVPKLPSKSKAIGAASALERMRKYPGVSVLLFAAPTPTVAFLPDIVNISVSGSPGGALPIPGAASASAPGTPAAASSARSGEAAKTVARSAKSAPVAAPVVPAPEKAVAYDQLVSDKPGERVYVEMDGQGNAMSYRYEIDPTAFEGQSAASDAPASKPRAQPASPGKAASPSSPRVTP